MHLFRKGSYVWGVLKFSINGAGKKALSAVPPIRVKKQRHKKI